MFWILITVIGILLFHQFYWRRRKLPHGPMPLPIFGNLLSFKNNKGGENMKKWRKKYGDLFTIWIGTMPVVTLHDSPTILETFLKDGATYEGRINANNQLIIKGGAYGVVFTEGHFWREQRRFALKVLKDFGVGKNVMQEKILNEFVAMANDIRDDMKAGKRDHSLLDEMDRSVGSIINSLMFGYRFGRDKIDQFFKVKRLAADSIKRANTPAFKILELHIDLLRHFPILKQAYEEFEKESKEFEQFFMDTIQKHKKEIDFEADQEPLDYCEAFLREQHRLDKLGEKDHSYSDKQLFGMAVDIWIGGQLSSSNTLSWVCVFALNHPHVQRQMHSELSRVIASDRLVTVEDRPQLPYINAVVSETLRLINNLVNILHKTLKDVVIHGHVIPKGTAITNALSSVMDDHRYFEEPQKFNPDRFLDDQGRFFAPPELMPFGVGKRACLGEGLARMELYLFVANIFNQFELSPESGVPPSMDKIYRGTTDPHRWLCQIKNRF